MYERYSTSSKHYWFILLTFWRLSPTDSSMLFKQSLLQKGVNEIVVDTATKRVFEEDDFGDSSQSTQHGMSKPALERLYLEASKQWLRGQNPSFENRKARIIRWLQYRGFSWGITSIIVRRLVSEYPPWEYPGWPPLNVLVAFRCSLHQSVHGDCLQAASECLVAVRCFLLNASSTMSMCGL